MDIDVIFNELSISTPADDIQTAQLWMVNFVTTIRAAVRAGAKRVVRSCTDLNATLLAADYPIARWRNDSTVDLDLRRYFRVLITRYPPLNDLPAFDEDMSIKDFFLDGNRAQGLGIAYLLESLAVSFISEERWNANKINQIEMQFLDDDGHILSDEIEVYHASQYSHIEQNSGWMEYRLRSGIESGQDLWSRKEELFPSLYFCKNIREEIENLFSGNPLLRQITKKLFEIERYCRVWQSGAFDPDNLPFKVTGEHEATMKKYGNERTFLCQGDVEIVFKLHGRITPGAWRIYFEPGTSAGSMYIGYIGPKLPSVDFPR